MSDTPTASDPAVPAKSEAPAVPTYNLFVSFQYSGLDNGIPKEDFDSRVIAVPENLIVKSSVEIKDIAEALAQSLFTDGKKYKDLHLTIISLTRLPL